MDKNPPESPSKAPEPPAWEPPPGQPRSGVDENGRALPISDEEWAARQVWLSRRLAEIDAADDTPEEVYIQFMRNLDETRRHAGRPPAFEGYY